MDDELLDVLDADGRPTGVTKARAAVHRDGDWHAAFHLWVVRPDGVLLQRRAAGKQSWAGYLDATAAGHLVAGEQTLDGLREAEEELGVAFDPDDLVALGVHVVDEPRAAGGRNRERQHLFLVRDDRPLTAYTELDASEVAGLVLVSHEDFAALVGGHQVAHGRAWDGIVERDTVVSADELVPAPYLPELSTRLLEQRF